MRFRNFQISNDDPPSFFFAVPPPSLPPPMIRHGHRLALTQAARTKYGGCHMMGPPVAISVFLSTMTAAGTRPPPGKGSKPSTRHQSARPTSRQTKWVSDGTCSLTQQGQSPAHSPGCTAMYTPEASFACLCGATPRRVACNGEWNCDCLRCGRKWSQPC